MFLVDGRSSYAADRLRRKHINHSRKGRKEQCHMDEKFFTPKEVAELLGVHPQTVRKWYQSGQLECYRVGRVRISDSQLERFLQKREQTDGSSTEPESPAL